MSTAERAAPPGWRYRVGVADVSQRQAVSALRRAAYREAAQFEWKDEATLDWSSADDAGTVLGLWNREGELLSTTRATVFAAAGDAEAFLEYSLAGIELPTPTLVLSRVATAPAVARHGLFAYLRYAYLAALPHTALASALAITYEGAPHVGSMRDAGYSFHEPQACWDTEATPLTRPLLAVLPRRHFAQALALRRADVQGRLAEVLIDDPAIVRALDAQCATVARTAG